MIDNSVHIILFDINNLKIERDENVMLENLLKDEIGFIIDNKNKPLFSHKGLKIKNIGFNILNKNKFIKWLISIIFPSYKIIDCQNMRIGHPDFILEQINKDLLDLPSKIFLELKIYEDALRRPQLEWFTNNKDKICKILWIEPSFEISKTYTNEESLL